MPVNNQFDILIIGTGSAGLMCALEIDSNLKIALISKDKIMQGSSYYAQGGISAVLSQTDNFNSHIADTLKSASGLGDEMATKFMVENAPDAINSLEKNGVVFSKDNEEYHLMIYALQ